MQGHIFILNFINCVEKRKRKRSCVSIEFKGIHIPVRKQVQNPLLVLRSAGRNDCGRGLEEKNLIEMLLKIQLCATC